MSTQHLRWSSLQTKAERARFAQIMRLMDQRYRGLSSGNLDRWLERKQRDGKHPELFGCFQGVGGHARDVRQVAAVTSSGVEGGRRKKLGISMLGVAADRIPELDWTEENIRLWLGRFVLCMKNLAGLNREVRAIRPHTMTWTPMQRLHDLIEMGIDVESDIAGEGTIRGKATVARDTGSSKYLKLRFVSLRQTAACPTSEPAGRVGESNARPPASAGSGRWT